MTQELSAPHISARQVPPAGNAPRFEDNAQTVEKVAVQNRPLSKIKRYEPPRASWSQVDKYYVEYCTLKGEGVFEIALKVDRTPREVSACLGLIVQDRKRYAFIKRQAVERARGAA